MLFLERAKCHKCGKSFPKNEAQLFCIHEEKGEKGTLAAREIKIGKSEQITFCSLKCLIDWLTPYVMEFKNAIKDRTFIPHEHDANEWFMHKMGLDQKYDPKKWKIDCGLGREDYPREWLVVGQKLEIGSFNFWLPLEDASLVEEKKQNLLAKAQKLERAGHYEEAATLYERIAKRWKDEILLDKARELRDRARMPPPLKVVSVDINTLIRQIKEGGLVVVYRCPKCGANIQISGDTKAESLKFCNYCGTKIEAMSLAEFLRSTLS
mgnify:CR=1 FL=1